MKYYVITAVVFFIAGGIVVDKFLAPKTVTQTVEKQVVVNKEIIKLKRPDGTVETKTVIKRETDIKHQFVQVPVFVKPDWKVGAAVTPTGYGGVVARRMLGDFSVYGTMDTKLNWSVGVMYEF